MTHKLFFRRENQRLRSDLKVKRPRDNIPTPDKLDDSDDLADSMTIEPIEAPSMSNGINGHMNGMPSLLETGLKNERNSTNGSTGDGMDDEARLFTFEKRIRIFSFSQLFSPYVSILFHNDLTKLDLTHFCSL